MDPYRAAHHPRTINPSLEATPGLEVAVGAQEVVITTTITELRVVVGLLIQAGVVELNHLRRHLHRFLLLARHQATSQSVLTIRQVLLHWHQIIHQDRCPVWPSRKLQGLMIPMYGAVDQEVKSHQSNGSIHTSKPRAKGLTLQRSSAQVDLLWRGQVIARLPDQFKTERQHHPS